MPGMVDRTAEFEAFVQASRSRRHVPAPAASAKAPHAPGQFAAAAGELGRRIHDTTQRLKQLASLARDRLTPESTLARLTTETNLEIKAISGDLKILQEVVKQRRAGVATNQFTQQHSETVVGTLNSQLKSATKQFKSILEQRNATLKSAAERQQREYTAAGLDSSGGSASAGVYSNSGFDGALVLSGSGGSGGGGSAAASAGGPGSHQLLLAEPMSATESFLRSRAEAVRNIERTIMELQDIFTQLTTTIAEQGEMVKRLDADVEISLENIQMGEEAIGRAWRRVSSNRGLILKLFGVILFFILLFVVVF